MLCNLISKLKEREIRPTRPTTSDKEKGMSDGDNQLKYKETSDTSDKKVENHAYARVFSGERVEKSPVELANHKSKVSEAIIAESDVSDASPALEDMTVEEVVAAVREFFPDGPPLLYPTMPDWRKFCDAFPHCVRDDRKMCTFYQPDKACHCELFDKAFPGVGWWCVGESGQVPATSQRGRRGMEEEPRYYISMPEEKEPVGAAGEAEAMGWGTEPGEASEVGARARTQFQSPPVDRIGFPDFPTFCDGYGKGCGKCRFFHDGRGPFCLVWGAAWPDFQRVIPARCGYPIIPEEKDAKAGRERLKADVAQVRARLKSAPLQVPDGPDWFAFCQGYPTGCDDCRYYAREKACWCRLWEACFPGVVHWYDWPE